MFYAYSKNTDSIIFSKDVKSNNDTFICPNPNCNAEYFLKGVNSSVTKHFCNYSRQPHISGCPYASKHTNFIDDINIIKSSIENICNNANSIEQKGIQPTTTSNMSSIERQYIRTPKQLLRFLLSNTRTTIYIDKPINDLIVDSINLSHNKNFEGFNGYKLVIAETMLYDSEKSVIELIVKSKTKSNTTYKLYLSVHINKALFSLIKNYTFANYKKFSGHQMAILANWNCTSKYHIECTITRNQNLIYIL